MSDDKRTFPSEIADKTEAEKFQYYYEKVTKAIRRFDTKNARKKLNSSLMEDPGSMANDVKWWIEHTENGPPKRAEEGYSKEIRDDLDIAFKSHFETLANLEASIGRKFLGSIKEGDDEPIQAARKAFRSKRKIEAPKRILWRRIVKALHGFYRDHQYVPTKGELYAEIGRYPVSEASVVVSRNTSKVTVSELDSPPRKVDKGQFSSALSTLGLADLPENERGNPDLSNC